jgi:hypothetical protein
VGIPLPLARPFPLVKSPGVSRMDPPAVPDIDIAEIRRCEQCVIARHAGYHFDAFARPPIGAWCLGRIRKAGLYFPLELIGWNRATGSVTLRCFEGVAPDEASRGRSSRASTIVHQTREEYTKGFGKIGGDVIAQPSLMSTQVEHVFLPSFPATNHG